MIERYSIYKTSNRHNFNREVLTPSVSFYYHSRGLFYAFLCQSTGESVLFEYVIDFFAITINSCFFLQVWIFNLWFGAYNWYDMIFIFYNYCFEKVKKSKFVGFCIMK